MRKSTEDRRCSVLVAGAGPVGLALAIDLGLRGVDCVLVEKRDGAVTVPKMSAVSARNMEFCRRWGIADTVRNAIWAENHSLDFVYMTTMRGRELARMRIGSRGIEQFEIRQRLVCEKLSVKPCNMG